MPVTSIETDAENLTITVIADFPVPVERLWAAYADPRQLERFWGPPGYPATFHRFDMRAGGSAFYSMTSPRGETHYGLWEFTALEPGRSFTVVDSFATPEGETDPNLPSGSMQMLFEATESGSRLTSLSQQASLEDLETILEHQEKGKTIRGVTPDIGENCPFFDQRATFDYLRQDSIFEHQRDSEQAPNPQPQMEGSAHHSMPPPEE